MCYDEHSISVFGWSDSMVALGWIQGEPARWKTFVANRVNQIAKIIPPQHWRYIKSSENPADCASRGITATALLEHPLWWQGPPNLMTFNRTNELDLLKYETNLEAK